MSSRHRRAAASAPTDAKADWDEDGAEDFFGDWEGDDDGEGRLVRFAREYGWRAYAIPVLTVLTVLVLVNMFQHPGSSVVAPVGGADEQTAAAAGTEEAGDGGAHREPAELPEGEHRVEELPPGGPFTPAGDGTYRTVGVPGLNVGEGKELKMRYVVEIENGVDTTTYGGDGAFSAMVDATLADPRSWTNDPRFGFEHVAADQEPDVKIRLTSQATTKELCGVNLDMETSCRTTITGEDTVLLNEARWVRGAVPFEGDIGRYRQYMINHEVGHALGFASHEACREEGALAPVMMQQTLSLDNSQLHSFDPEEVYPDDNKRCRTNPWPYPRPAAK